MPPIPIASNPTGGRGLRYHWLLPSIPVHGRILPKTPFRAVGRTRNRPFNSRRRRHWRSALEACACIHPSRETRPSNPQAISSQQDPSHQQHGAWRNRIREICVRQHPGGRYHYSETSCCILGYEKPCVAPRGGERVQVHVFRIPTVWFRCA